MHENFAWGMIATAAVLAMLFFLTLAMTPVAIAGIAGYVGYRLYKESPSRAERVAKRETMALYQNAVAGSAHLRDEEIVRRLTAVWPASTPTTLELQLVRIGLTLFEAEHLATDVPPPPALHNTVEAARYRDHLARLGQSRNDPGLARDALAAISESLAPIARAAPPIDGDVLLEVSQFLEPLGPQIEAVMAPYFKERDYPLFQTLRDQLSANITATHRTQPVLPRDYRQVDVVDVYLKGTPLRELFSLRTPFAIPEAARFEHLHMVAGTGHGKTQTLQHLISKDLPDIARAEKSVVVIDSQGDLINTILKAEHLPPDRIVLIDPEDIAYPVALNLFSAGQERLTRYSDLERERLSNSIIELYDFVLGSLLSSGMTAKQSVVFRYVTRLIFHIPDATIHTLRDVMEPGGVEAYREHISKLDGTARRFFETEFESKEFAATKTQVLRRLYGILENQTFERMFSEPQSKFDMFAELNAGKLILINTAKSLLKEQGTEIFGRFFIALIAQAAQERATLAPQERTPTFVYIDEAQDYFDPTISVILSQARKYNVGMVIAHQYLGQLSGGLQEAVEANTGIKLVGGVSARDARTLAGQMNADAAIIQRQQNGCFATHIRGLTDRAVSMSFPFFVLEKLPRQTKDGRAAIVQHSRDRYARAWQPASDYSPPPENPPDPEPPKKPPEDPAEFSPEL